MDPVVLSAGEPGFDTTNNILKIGDGSTSFANLQQLGFDSNGRFGIGTTSPSGELHIQDGTLHILSDGSIPHFELVDTDTNNTLRLNATNSVFAFNLDPDQNIAGSELRFNVDGTDKLTLKHNATVFDQNVTINSSTNQAIIGNSISVFNEGGADVDFRVEGATDANLLFCDASLDAVRIGTGSDGGVGSKLHVYEANRTNSTYSRTINVLGRGYSSTDGTYYHVGTEIRAEKYLSASTTDGGYCIGVNAAPIVYSPDGTNVLAEVTAFRCNPSINSAASNVTVTNAYDIKTVPYFQGTNNTVTNHYGLYLGDAGAGGTTPTNEYGVYQVNTAATNYFGGNVGIGTDSPSKLLDVEGVAKAKSFVSDYSVVSDASTVTFDLDSANHFEVVLGANRTLALSNSGTAGQKFTVKLKQDGTGSRTVTWFSTINWPGGLVPTLSTAANKADTFGFICTSTNSFDGFVIGYNL